MHTEYSSNPVPSSTNIRKTRKFLISRQKRRIFFFRFILMTVLGWIVGGIASLALKRFFVDLLPAVINFPHPVLSVWGEYVSNLLFALIFGADQALVVRQYVSGRRWMITTTLGWLVATNVSALWVQHIYLQAVSLERVLSSQEIFLYGFLSTLAYIISGLWLGFFQWLVLRRYAVNAWKWVFVPAISFFLISFSMLFLAQAREVIPLLKQNVISYFSEQILTALMLGIVPGIMFCTLRIRPKVKPESEVGSQESGVRSQE